MHAFTKVKGKQEQFMVYLCNANPKHKKLHEVIVNKKSFWAYKSCYRNHCLIGKIIFNTEFTVIDRNLVYRRVMTVRWVPAFQRYDDKIIDFRQTYFLTKAVQESIKMDLYTSYIPFWNGTSVSNLLISMKLRLSV